MYSFGMIGTGIIAGCHLEAIAAHTRTRLAAVADVVRPRAEAAAAPFGAAVYTDYHQMLENEHLDAVIINLPHGLHEPCAIDCAEHGAHILLEKPMSVSPESCERIIQACERHHVLLQIGHVQRYRPENRAARAIIESGELGELVMIDDHSTGEYFTPERPAWFMTKKLAGGGVSINFGVHTLDRFCYLTGSSVASITGACTYQHPGSDVDGSAHFFLRAQSGVTGSVSISGYPSIPEEYTTLYLTKGAICIRPFVSVCKTTGGEYDPVDFSSYPGMFEAQMEDFVTAMDTGRVLYYTGAEGKRYVEAISSIW